MNIETRFARGWQGGLHDGTPCGRGSTIENTRVVRMWLPEICEKYAIKSMNDAACGDLHWITHISWPVKLAFFDLIKRDPRVIKFDVTMETLPPADAILCRHALNHMDPLRVGMALDRFKESGGYLIATQFAATEATEKDFRAYDLREWLGECLEQIPDITGHLAIWKL